MWHLSPIQSQVSPPIMSITNVDMLALATNPLYFNTLAATNITQPAISLLAYDTAFEQSVVYPNATARLLSNESWEAFHEAGIYDASQNALYVASNYDNLEDNVNITVIYFDNDYSVKNITSTQFPGLYEANGGTTYYPPGSDISSPPPNQLWCDEGDFQHYSALVSVNPASNTSQAVNNNYLGRNYSSLNDARQHPITGDIWFTDAAYGRFQFFRPIPTIPQQVYRFEPTTGHLQVVASDFDQPNGIVSPPLSPETLGILSSNLSHRNSLRTSKRSTSPTQAPSTSAQTQPARPPSTPSTSAATTARSLNVVHSPTPTTGSRTASTPTWPGTSGPDVVTACTSGIVRGCCWARCSSERRATILRSGRI